MLMYSSSSLSVYLHFFFFNDTATTEIYTLSLHDALPISLAPWTRTELDAGPRQIPNTHRDRKSTRLNSSHRTISYAVFCLKKKKKKHQRHNQRQHKNKHEQNRREVHQP